jgi:SAM-dependent methyltransferase
MDQMRARDASAAQAVPRVYFASLDLKEGHRVLEVGCGTGDEARWMAPLVGPTGWIVGVDYSQTMVDVATERTADLGLPVEFRQGDACALEFADETFDRCRASHTLSALHDPGRVVAEMARVARSDGRVVVVDQDWDTLVIDAADHRVTRAVRAALCDGFPSGWVGRRLPGLFQDAGLTDIVVRNGVSSWTETSPDNSIWRSALDLAERSGAVNADDASAWLADVRRRADAGRYFAAVMVFMVIGRKG